MDNQIVVNNYAQIDKILKEEQAYILNLCKKIKKAGCNVLLIQYVQNSDIVFDVP